MCCEQRMEGGPGFSYPWHRRRRCLGSSTIHGHLRLTRSVLTSPWKVTSSGVWCLVITTSSLPITSSPILLSSGTSTPLLLPTSSSSTDPPVLCMFAVSMSTSTWMLRVGSLVASPGCYLVFPIPSPMLPSFVLVSSALIPCFVFVSPMSSLLPFLRCTSGVIYLTRHDSAASSTPGRALVVTTSDESVKKHFITVSWNSDVISATSTPVFTTLFTGLTHMLHLPCR